MKPLSYFSCSLSSLLLSFLLITCNEGTVDESGVAGIAFDSLSSVDNVGEISKNDGLVMTEKKPAPAQQFRYSFISYHNKNKEIRDSARAFIKSLSPAEKNIIFRLNRVDELAYTRLDTFIIPDKIDTNWMAYAVYPTYVPALKNVPKIILFGYYPQAFAVYENGQLIRTGPTSMGKQSTPTPTGLFFTNWKARKAISTVDPDWIMFWNFNISNYGGIGFHQYLLPGYPASHSCLRLLEEDAYFLYNWADQWQLKKGQLAAKGTPVLVFGEYPFGKGKPWWRLVENPNALDISTEKITTLVQPYLPEIMNAVSRK